MSILAYSEYSHVRALRYCPIKVPTVQIFREEPRYQPFCAQDQLAEPYTCSMSIPGTLLACSTDDCVAKAKA